MLTLAATIESAIKCFRCNGVLPCCKCRDRCTIINADCRDVLDSMKLPAGSIVVTDPPYGISHKSNGQIFQNADAIAGDESLELADAVRAWCERMNLPLAMFFSPYRPMDGWRSVLVWDKGGHVGGGGDRATCWKRDFELIGVERNEPLNGQRDSAVLRFRALLPPPSGHFAEKPVGLIKYLIQKMIGPVGVVVDPFAGSGTTLRAAKDLGAPCIGIEIEEKWCQVAARRLEQGGLF